MGNLDNFKQDVESPNCSGPKLKFNGLNLSKNYIPSPKTLLTDLSNITFNWLVVWKMTWGIWQIISRALKIGISMGSFSPNLKKYELKMHREVICHDNKELHKIWRGSDLSFQSWHKEFDEFWSEHLKVSQIFILMGSFWAKYILFELKNYRGVIFYETEEGYKFGDESTCHFKTDIRNLRNFDLSTRKFQNCSL